MRIGLTSFGLQAVQNAIRDPEVDSHLDALRPLIRSEYTFTTSGDYRSYPPPDPDKLMEPTEEDINNILVYLDQVRPRFNAVISLLKDRWGQRGLDVGICYGLIDVVLRETYGVLIEGAELPINIPAYCAIPLNRGIPVTPWQLGTTPPFDPESFDFIVFMDVLEHLKLPPGRTIATLASLIKPGGALVLTTPNFARYENIAKLVRGENIVQPYPEDLPDEVDSTDYVGHIREYTIGEVARHIEDAGLVIEHMSTCNQWRPHNELLPNPLLNDIIIAYATKKCGDRSIDHRSEGETYD